MITCQFMKLRKKTTAIIGVDNINNPAKTKDITCPNCISVMQKLLNKFTNASTKEKIPNSNVCSRFMENFANKTLF